MFNASTTTKKRTNKYLLQNNNIYSKISTKTQINFDKENNHSFDKKFNEYINIFINYINTNPSIDLKLFYENLKSLIIEEKRTFNKLLFIKSHTKGHYDGYDNKIVVLKEDNFYSIYHELLHCASRKIAGSEMKVGFHKFVVVEKSGKISFNMGKSLNEGYTTLLEKRYFNSIEHTQKRGYIIEEFISSMLEKIVGKEEMEKLYFEANLDGFIAYLKQFSSEEDICLFLQYFDKVFVNSKTKVKPKDAEYIYKFIAIFLLKSYIHKLGGLIQNSKINREEFLELFDEFVRLLSTNTICDNKNTYYLLTPEITDQILDEVCEELDNKSLIKSPIL